jgi:hypothetical protein
LFLPSLRAETEFSLKAVEEGTKEAGVSFSAETDAAVDCWEGISLKAVEEGTDQNLYIVI